MEGIALDGTLTLTELLYIQIFKIMNEDTLEPYKEAYSEDKLWKKITKFAKKIGVKAAYTMLLLYYAFKRPDTPYWAKSVITGILGYFISPIDFIPDLTPFLGLTDDFSIAAAGLAVVAAYINQDVKQKAKTQLTKWFGSFDEAELQFVEDKINS